jgi:hypothetical protein
MKKGYRSTVFFSIIAFALTFFFYGMCNAQIIYGVTPLPFPLGIAYTPNPLIALGSLPPIYPYVGDTISAFDSFTWPTGVAAPPTSLSAISYAVPGAFSSYPNLTDPQIYLSTSFPTYVNYLNLYFAANQAGSTLPGAFGPFNINSVTAYGGLANSYPYYNYVDISSLLTFYALNPVSSFFTTAYPLIL